MSSRGCLLLVTELTSTVPFSPEGGSDAIGYGGLTEAAWAGLLQ
jgi:hypothetical protein